LRAEKSNYPEYPDAPMPPGPHGPLPRGETPGAAKPKPGASRGPVVGESAVEPDAPGSDAPSSDAATDATDGPPRFLTTRRAVEVRRGAAGDPYKDINPDYKTKWKKLVQGFPWDGDEAPPEDGGQKKLEDFDETDETMCDDQFLSKGCKYKVATNKLKCCKICPDRLGFEVGSLPPFEGAYGWDEFLEKDPNGGLAMRLTQLNSGKDQDAEDRLRVQLARADRHGEDAMRDELMASMGYPQDDGMTAEQTLVASMQTEGTKADVATREVVNANTEAKAGSRKFREWTFVNGRKARCPQSRQQDDFTLPCCRPCAGSKSVAMIRDFWPPAPGTTDEEPLSGGDSMECCASEPSCCRWCPETVCEALEASGKVDALWWALCRQYSADEVTQETYFRRKQALMETMVGDGTLWQQSVGFRIGSD
jgi:hypothetical protein